jgi:hypothetical protein
MQICYRCKEKTNQALEKMAKKNGVSKNHLIDKIIKNHLNNSWISSHEPSSRYPEKEVLSGIQYANKLLAQILEELNYIFIYINNKPTTDVDIIISDNIASDANNNVDSPTNKSINIDMPENTEHTEELISTNISAQCLSFSTFYTRVIYLLLEVSETLEMIRKKANI